MLLTYNPPTTDTHILPRRKCFYAKTHSLLQNEEHSTNQRGLWCTARAIVMRSIGSSSSPCSLFCSAITITITVLLIDHFKWTITPSCKEFIGALEWLWKKIVKTVKAICLFTLCWSLQRWNELFMKGSFSQMFSSKF